MTSLADIERTANQVLKADLHAAAERAKLHAMIIEAHQSGEVSDADIARAAGVSRQRVGQICSRARWAMA